MSMSRRTFLKGLGISAAGVSFFPLAQSHAQTTPSNEDVAAFYRFKLGSYDMITIYDGTLPLPVSFVATNSTFREIKDELEARMVPMTPTNNLTATILNLVLVDGERIAIFDTGNGTSVGKLLPTLAAAGVDPASVTDVVISHYHPDHINGLSSNGNLTFPNAMVHFPQVEYDFIDNAPTSVGGAALNRLKPALDAGQVAFFAPDAEIISGVQAIAAPGHTPGHSNFLISSGDSQLVHLADTAVSPYASLPFPDWHFGADTDPELAVTTRKAILSRISGERVQAFGYHYPFPGLGYAVRQGEADSWMWVPAAF